MTPATPVQQQTSSKWEPWVHTCGFVLLLRMVPDGVGKWPQWQDDFEDTIVTECPKCNLALDVRDGG